MYALRNVVVLTALLAGVGAAVAWFAAVTEEDVQRNRLAAETRILRELAGVDVDAAAGDVLLCDENLAVLRGTGRGYGGEFRLAIAVHTEAGGRGQVAGVRLVEHAETPGFGDILAAGSAWLDSFRHGRVDAVTGATVTSQAVIDAVERTVARLEREGLCP